MGDLYDCLEVTLTKKKKAWMFLKSIPRLVAIDPFGSVTPFIILKNDEYSLQITTFEHNTFSITPESHNI